MSVTEKLHRVFVVDKQIRGLQSKLRAAERFLSEQQRQLGDLGKTHGAVQTQLRQLTASSANAEGEAQKIEEHITELRDRMNSAKTNKEYKALLTEVNTFKERKAAIEEETLGQMETLERLKTQLEELESAKGERTKVEGIAKQDRDQRADEIKDRLVELEKERAGLVGEVPSHVLSAYEELLDLREEEAMAPIEIADRKRHEFHCGSCMMSLPVETMSSLLSRGDLTMCVSCGCILYLEESTREAMSAKR